MISNQYVKFGDTLNSVTACDFLLIISNKLSYLFFIYFDKYSIVIKDIEQNKSYKYKDLY